MKQTITFSVYGIPKARKAAQVVTRVRTKTGYKHLDHPIFYDVTDKPWMILVYNEAIKVKPDNFLEGPLLLYLTFRLPKPKSKPKYRRWSDTKPDLDNLIQVIKNVLQGVFYRNDSQICILRCVKRWVEWDEPAGVSILLETIKEVK